MLPGGERGPLCSRCSRGAPQAAPPLRDEKGVPAARATVPAGSGGAAEWFPFPKLRPHQDELYREARELMEKGAFLLAEAPTGIGKTAAALAAGLSAIRGDGKARGKTIIFLTARQTQHRIAVDTLRDIMAAHDEKIAVVDVIAKQAMCPRPEASLPRRAFIEFCGTKTRNNSCEYLRSEPQPMVDAILRRPTHAQELKVLGRQHTVCPHKAAHLAGPHADVWVCDYNYLFSDMREMAMERLGLDLSDLILIVDEAHQLPERIRNEMAHELGVTSFDSAVSYARRADRELIPPLVRFRDLFSAVVGRVDHEEVEMDLHDLLERLKVALHSDMTDPMDLEQFHDRIDMLGQREIEDGEMTSGLLDLAEFLELSRAFTEADRGTRSADWILSGRPGSDGYPPRLRLQGLDPRRIAQEVFENVHGGILMSGTFSPGEMYQRILGIPKDRVRLAHYNNPFPRENRPIFHINDVSTSSSKRGPAMYTRIAERIADAASRSRRGTIAFFPSYRVLSEVRGHYPSRGVLPEVEERRMTKDDREEIIERMGEGSLPIFFAVLGGSLSEGIDYPEGALDLIIIVGVPYLPPNLEVKRWEGYIDREIDPGKGREYGYIRPTLMKVVQAAGRGNRRASDRCAVILMDDRYHGREIVRALPLGFSHVEFDSHLAEFEAFFESIPFR